MAVSLRKRVATALDPALRARGFQPASHPYFVRPKAGWMDVVWADASPDSRATFTVTYGVHVPYVATALAPLGIKTGPSPQISRNLASQRSYTPVPNALIAAIVPTVLKDFDSEAELWLGRFGSVHDVAEQYRMTEADSHTFNGRSLVVYALLLEAGGEWLEARKQFEAAADRLGSPVYAVGRRFFQEPVAESRRVPGNAFDELLLSFVRERLGSPRRDA